MRANNNKQNQNTSTKTTTTKRYRVAEVLVRREGKREAEAAGVVARQRLDAHVGQARERRGVALGHVLAHHLVIRHRREPKLGDALVLVVFFEVV